METRPVPKLTITWTNAARQEILLLFELKEPASPDQLANLKGLVTSFVAVGSHGGFAREMTAPSESLLILTHVNLSSPTLPVFLLTGQQIDVRAFQLIRHLAWKWSISAQSINSITVADETPGQQGRQVQLPDVTWGTETASYPPLSQQLRIRVEREDPADYQKERRCVVEFGRPVPSEVFRSTVHLLEEWVALVGQGAYGPPVKSVFEAEVWQENLAPYDEYSVELAFSLFEASEFAWYALLNCLQCYSLTVEPITIVIIE